MTELWLVRHGQTDWNLQRRYQGQTDPPLNATGLQQAELAGEALVGRRYAAIYSSDLQRARVTAEIIGRRLGMEVFVDSRLREVSFGKWEGMLVADIQTRYPVEWEARQQDRLYARPPGGESVQDVAARIWPAREVLKKMGTAPKRVKTGTNDFGSYRILVFGKRFKVTILDQRGVTMMSTMSGAQRTFDGIGVGSTRQQVRGAYAVMCERVPGQPGQQVCLTNEPAPGETTTVFRLQNKIVTQVDVATLVD